MQEQDKPVNQHPRNHDSGPEGLNGMDSAGRRERVVERMLHERLGGDTPPDLSRRILANLGRPVSQAQAQGAVHVLPKAHPAQRLYWAAAAAIAVLSLVGFAVATIYLGSDLANRGSTGIAEGNQRQSPQPAPKLQPQTPGPIAPQPAPAPTPKPTPAPDVTPDVAPEITPEKLPDHVDRPGPEPELPPLPPAPNENPQPTPGPTVDKPAPEPEAPAPMPPEPENPGSGPANGPTVEVPPSETPGENPTKPDHAPTEVPKAAVVSVGKVVHMSDRAQLTFRRAAADRWQDFAAETSVDTGMMLKARKPVTIQLADGSRMHFDGEIALAGTGDTLEITIETESVYFEGYGSKSEITLRRNDAAVTFRDAEVLAERSGARLVVTCLGGEIASGEATLQGGYQASLTGKGFSREKRVGSKLRSHNLVSSVDTQFSLTREEMDGDSASRFERAQLENGVAVGKGKEAFCIVPPRELQFAEGAYVRMRIRLQNSQGFSIGAGTGEEAGNRYFQHHMNFIPNGKWIIVKVPLSELMDEAKDQPEPPKDKPAAPKEGQKQGQRDPRNDGKPENKPEGKDPRKLAKGKHLWPGAKVMFMKIVTWSEDAQLEVDWMEWGIEPEWARK